MGQQNEDHEELAQAAELSALQQIASQRQMLWSLDKRLDTHIATCEMGMDHLKLTLQRLEEKFDEASKRSERVAKAVLADDASEQSRETMWRLFNSVLLAVVAVTGVVIAILQYAK